MNSSKNILIKTPYNIKSCSDAENLLNHHVQVLQQFSSKEQNIKIDQFCSLSQRTLERPIHLIKSKTMKNKTTGEIIELIEQIDIIKQNSYDYIQMGDFEISRAQNTIQDFITQLSRKVFKKQQPITNHLHLPLPNLLKSYNLAPSPRDLLYNYGNKPTPLTTISQSILYGQPTPSKTLTEIPLFIKNSAIFILLQKYMQKRPCWLKNVLLAQLKQEQVTKFSECEFKNALRYICYTYRSGPWKNTYCLLGYSPEKSYKNVIYQQFTIKFKTKEAEDYQHDNEIEEIYDPTFRDISKRCGRSYQLCDIDDENIREIINGRLLIEDSICTKEYGFLSRKQHDNITNIMKTRINHQ